MFCFCFFACLLAFFSRFAGAASFPRQYPAEATALTTIYSPGGVRIRYKESNICETTPGVKSYSGYVDLDRKTHMYFWFFESRNSPSIDPTTLWLTGGPGSDSLVATLTENGPCWVKQQSDVSSPEYNIYSWNKYSNVLYLDQPIGVGFSYSEEEKGSLNSITGEFVPESINSTSFIGTWPVTHYLATDTTKIAAVTVWHTLQAFFSNLRHLDSSIKSKDFHLFTESYGGTYGPIFWDYFTSQNQAISNGSEKGYELNMKTLGIGNGLIEPGIQFSHYPKFVVNNTYGIVAVNQTVLDYMTFALNYPNGCLAQISACHQISLLAEQIPLLGQQATCAEADNMCNDNVLGPYVVYSGRSVYDIRNLPDTPDTSYYSEFLNNASVQAALGVSVNSTLTNNDVYFAFQQSGDAVTGYAFQALEKLLGQGVRVVLYYGDADFICNWFGGEAVSLAVNYTYSAQFKAAGYAPFHVDGVEYGEVREYGNFSFIRIYEAGHQVPYFQPLAAQALFQRAINGLDIAEGIVNVTNTYSTNGTKTATHTESYSPLPTGPPVGGGPGGGSLPPGFSLSSGIVVPIITSSAS